MTVLWMPAALSSDLPAGTAMPVATRFGALALWRSGSGRVFAFADRCPHRGMRLSHGFVRGEALACIYHGWRYGDAGRCLAIPAHPDLTPPPAIRVAAHAAAEADGLVWVAPGDADAADASGEAALAAGPPRFPGLAPLRSLTAEAPPAAVADACGAAANAAGLVAGAGLSLLLAAQPDDRTLIHVLLPVAATPAERLAASRAADALRRAAEARADGSVRSDAGDRTDAPGRSDAPAPAGAAANRPGVPSSEATP